jgi:putative thioredoxin
VTSTPFSARGAVDLGALAAARESEKRASQAKANAPEGVMVDINELNFEAEVVERSMTIPVVLDMWSARSAGSQQLSPILATLAAEYGGRWILGRVDVDTNQQIAAAFQVQSIPAVFAVLKGQPVPLFDRPYPEAQIRQVLEQLLVMAAEQGVAGSVGDAAAVGSAADGQPAGELVEPEPPLDPRFDAAFDAVEAGDWDAADGAYRTILDTTPADADALAGVAMVGLYRRTEHLIISEVRAAAEANPDSVEALSELADLDALSGDWGAAFRSLVACIKLTSGDERSAIRSRILDLFLIAGDDPSVAPARIALANALY